MADKTIGSLPQAQTVDDASLFVCEQQGTAMKTTGAQWKGFAVNAVSQYVEPAQQAAQQAQQAAQQAQDAADSIGDSVSQAQTAAQQAQAAQQAVENLGVTSNTLPVGQEATVTKTVDETGAVTLAFGIPQGPQGPRGPEGPQGGPGATGPQGAPGEAATVEIGSVTTGAPGTSAEVTNSGTAKAAVLNFTIPQGPQGAKGDTGPRGPQGETGEGFVVKGYFATLSALQSGVPSPSAGDAYGVGSAEPYDIYIWDGVNYAWVNNGPLQGAKGPQGDPGSAATIEIGTVTTAPAGSDAAVTNSGTSSAAVLNFTIPQGATGPQGPAGVDGSPGPAGADGAPGATGPQGEPGQDATINGVTTLTLDAAGGIKGTQSGSTYTLDGSDLVQKVSGAVNGNIPTLTADGQIVDSGKSITDIAGGVPVVEISSEDGVNYTGFSDQISELVTGTAIIAIPDKTSTASECKLSINGSELLYCRMKRWGASVGQYPYYPNWMSAGEPVILIYELRDSGTASWKIIGVFRMDFASVSGTVRINQGGTGAASAEQARTNLSAIGRVSSATEGNLAALTSDGQIQDSGKSLDDLGNNDFVVSFTGTDASITCDKTYAEILAAIEAGKNVYAIHTIPDYGKFYLPLNTSMATESAAQIVFATVNVFMGFGRMWLSVAQDNTIKNFISYFITPKDINIQADTDYGTARVRGISLTNATPSAIPNGFLVGVYE